MNENNDFNENEMDDGLDDLINSIESETSSSMDNISADMSKETEEEISKRISDLKSETRKRKENKMTEKKERKNLKYNKYIVARIFLAIQTGGTSELAFWLGRKSTEDGIQKHIDSSSSD